MLHDDMQIQMQIYSVYINIIFVNVTNIVPFQTFY